MVSQRSDATRISNSTSSDKKSIGRRTSRRDKYLKHLMEEAESQGREFVPMLSHEEYKEQQRVKMVVMVDGTKSNRPPQQVITEGLEQLAAQRFTQEELMEKARLMDTFFRPKFAALPQSDEAVATAHFDMLVDRGNNEWFCVLCQKVCYGGLWGTRDAHCQSDLHKTRVWEHAAANQMIGRARSARRFSSTPGFVGNIGEGEEDGGWRGFKEYWGDDVITNMGEIIWNRLRSGVRLQVDMPHWGKKQHLVLTHNQVCDIVPGAVSYGGSGKYFEGVNKVVPFVKSDQLIDNDGYHKAPEGGHRAGEGRGWWPVSIITWHGQHSDHGYHDSAVYFRDMWSGRTKCYVLCWYQLMDGSMILTVWAVYMIGASRL
jgi:hypothetical protein